MRSNLGIHLTLLFASAGDALRVLEAQGGAVTAGKASYRFF